MADAELYCNGCGNRRVKNDGDSMFHCDNCSSMKHRFCVMSGEELRGTIYWNSIMERDYYYVQDEIAERYKKLKGV